ncbi:bile acid:sodium symporter family protein [Polymorphospora rubra]|uniref:Bile acid:sodium symporter n=1 Tax=Polymorphospora rubra TaxID=338584 RepID=A0A810ND61_9ACTN|nr:bile acid:sodium symporter family protein [Polymorphospora rubra]BCJ70009.1 bile acid:sodium symporter [Polymorphospora rubra]
MGAVRWPRWLVLDPFIVAMLAVVVVATLLPVRGTAADVAGTATKLGVALLFFLHGARIAPRAALAGARHWRLHIVVLLLTFAVFPLLGIAAGLLVPALLTSDLHLGLLFLCAVPSTVQSSIAFTSMARGNVPAAVFSASFSNIAGIGITPLLAAALLAGTGGVALTGGAIGAVVLQLLVPFAAGQISRRWTADWLDRHRQLTGIVDRSSILLVVYTAFSAGVVAGIWQQISPGRLAGLLLVVGALLATVLGLAYGAARLLGFSRADRVTIVFCGSKKSLATGLPMATVLFSGANLGLLLLPMMLFHQIQLIVCAALARAWAARAEPPPAAPAPPSPAPTR